MVHQTYPAAHLASKTSQAAAGPPLVYPMVAIGSALKAALALTPRQAVVLAHRLAVVGLAPVGLRPIYLSQEAATAPRPAVDLSLKERRYLMLVTLHVMVTVVTDHLSVRVEIRGHCKRRHHLTVDQ